MAPIPLLIDTDPGVDDAWAILMAGRAPGWQIQALTVVGGNVGLSATCRNARILVDWLGQDIPIHAGASAPLLGGFGNAAHVHGQDGFGDAHWPDPQSVISDLPAAMAIVEHARLHAGRLQLLALGPLTNVALALRLEPALPQLIHRLVVMGGALDGVGNLTDRAEFNVAFDPEAAEMVFRDWNRLDLMDWSNTLRVPPPIDRIEALLSESTPWAQRMQRCTRAVRTFLDDIGANTWALADPLAAHVLLDHPAGAGEACSVEVLLDQGPRRGETVVSSARTDRAQVHVAPLKTEDWWNAVCRAVR